MPWLDRMGSTHWSRADFKKIEPGKSLVGADCFCDEQGTRNPELPVMYWTVTFSKIAVGTRVEILISFESEADMDKVIAMGFKEGFAAAHSNLDELLARS